MLQRALASSLLILLASCASSGSSDPGVVCGDGAIGGTEQCDDGDTTGGDGCSSTCTIELGWACAGSPSVCTSDCGNGFVDVSETCDDANGTDGDGCSAVCAVEPFWSCVGEPSVCTRDTCDVAGWQVVQASSFQTFTFGAGTLIPAGGVLVLARGPVTQQDFEAYWGTTLGADGVFVDSGGGSAPQINGDETYTLQDDAFTVIDGPTIAMAPVPAGQSLRRIDADGGADVSANWAVGPDTDATPGFAESIPTAPGVVISEFSDALGTGNFVFEFVELVCR